jgi:hypothetical protein
MRKISHSFLSVYRCPNHAPPYTIYIVRINLDGTRAPSNPGPSVSWREAIRIWTEGHHTVVKTPYDFHEPLDFTIIPFFFSMRDTLSNTSIATFLSLRHCYPNKNGKFGICAVSVFLIIGGHFPS